MGLVVRDGLRPMEFGRLLCLNLLRRPYMRYGEEGLHYAQACAAMGALRFASLAGDGELLARLLARYEPLRQEGSGLVSRRAHMDLRVVGIVPLTIFRLTGDRRHLALGLSLADAQWEEPRPDGLTRETRWWIDDVYMVGALQMEVYRATGERKYADRAARQVAAYLAVLQGKRSLLSAITAPRPVSSGEGGTGGSPPRWPRCSRAFPKTIPLAARSQAVTWR